MQEMIVCIHSATTYAKWIKTRRGHVQRLVVPKKISVSNFRYGYLYSCLGKEETNYVSSVLMFSLYRLTKESRLIRKIIVYTLLRISLIKETFAWLRGISSSNPSCHVARDFNISSLSGGIHSLGAARSNLWLQIRDSPCYPVRR